MTGLDYNLIYGMMLLMGANIGLGSIPTIFNGTFDVKKFFIGIAKALLITICFSAVAFAGSLNPDVMSVTVNDIEVNLITGINGAILASYIAYSAQSIKKLYELIVPKKEK